LSKALASSVAACPKGPLSQSLGFSWNFFSVITKAQQSWAEEAWGPGQLRKHGVVCRVRKGEVLSPEYRRLPQKCHC
jgi:hypothetical protein